MWLKQKQDDTEEDKRGHVTSGATKWTLKLFSLILMFYLYLNLSIWFLATPLGINILLLLQRLKYMSLTSHC